MYTILKKKTIFIFIIILLITFGTKAFAENQKQQLVLILVPELSFQEVNWLKEKADYQDLWITAGMAGMNIRPDGPYSYLNNMVSLSTGTRGVGVEGWNSYLKGEIVNDQFVEEIYQQWTGKRAESPIIHPLFHKLVDKNRQTSYRAEVGLLGQLLKDNGIHRFVIGNSDFQEERIRYGSLMTIDQEGITEGDIKAIVKKPFAPSGITMDQKKIFEMLSTDANYASFIVIEWGDLSRLFKQKNTMTVDYFDYQYEQTLRNLEWFVADLSTHIDNIILLSPMMHSDAYQKRERLAPLFIWQGKKHLSLYSETTRQPFVVSNLDIVPTILDFYGIQSSSHFFGKPIQIQEEKSSIDEGLKNIDLMFHIFQTRNVILSGYITLLVVLLVIVSIVIFLKDNNFAWRKATKVLLVSGLSSPFWLLISPYWLNYIDTKMYFLSLLLCSIVSGYVVIRFFHNPIFIISSLLVLSITVDLLFESYFMKRSYLGYDPVIGARYYGIGNEYAGIYIISVLLLLENRLLRKWFLLLLISIGHVFVLSSTYIGANAGATLSAGIMYGFFYYKYQNKSFQWKSLVVAFSLIIVILLILLFFNQLGGRESHIGYAFSRLFQGDFLYITDTIKRKIEMNWKIFRFSNWTQLFVTTYLLIALYLWRRKKLVEDKTKKLLIQTGVVASIALLLLNDSGVVAAATSMFMIVCTSYYWVIEKQAKT